ncbi:SH3 domain-binding glutamic acid-rich-like protein 3 [Halichoeres trimaculatus]|uniref:SH3 domain-binding glutamic acid-rich-like protein 3 n=1 Tax=Halichoeres trimaculatus TaxID=147232 RepID=UPI003D9DE9AC
MSLKVFYTSVSGNLEIKKHQERIFQTLDSLKIKYEKVDISQDSTDKDLMRKIAGDTTALPPQICNGDVYCGNYDAFDAAIEDEKLELFLKI